MSRFRDELVQQLMEVNRQIQAVEGDAPYLRGQRDALQIIIRYYDAEEQQEYEKTTTAHKKVMAVYGNLVEQEEGSSKKKKANPAVEPWYGMFQAAFAEVKEDDELEYEGKTKDFVQLRAFLKRPKVAAWLTEERWQRGLENYFVSEMTGHSLADFCTRFPVFYKSALDKYRQPMEAPEPKRKVQDEDEDAAQRAKRERAEIAADPERLSFSEAKQKWGVPSTDLRSRAVRALDEVLGLNEDGGRE